MEPIHHELRVECRADQAFETWVERIGDWWSPQYTAEPGTLEAVTIEPFVGGRVYATHGDVGEHDWGEVTAFDRGRRLAHSFTLAQDEGNPSEVSVEFEDVEGGCVVRLAHGGWTKENERFRSKFTDWPVMLERLRALAEGGATVTA